MAVEEINAAGGVNGKMIEIIEFDSGSDPKQASLAARTLVKDHDVLAIIGPFSLVKQRSALMWRSAKRL